MLLMATYGTLERVGPQHSRSWEDADGQSHSTRVQYPEIVYNHYKYRHSVDDHNNRRQSPISLEKTWSTHWWPNRVFAFLIAISEVNTLKAWTNIYQNPDMETLDFRKQLADELINNPFLAEETAAEARGTRKSARNSGHELLSLPPKKKWCGAQMVDSQSLYPCRKCVKCGRKSRDYCSCTPGTTLCRYCFPDHRIQVEIAGNSGE